MINMKKNFYSLGLLCFLLGWTGLASAYGYPIHDRYEATVAGTPLDVRYKWDSPRKVKQEILTPNFEQALSDILLAGTFGLAYLKMSFANR